MKYETLILMFNIDELEKYKIKKIDYWNKL